MPSAVAVIGCGPAGLAAAHAAVGLGHPVTVFSDKKKKSPLRGPLLLQRPIPGMTLTHPDGYVKQIVIGGSITDYRYKLYGDININIQGDILQGGYHAWKIHETYDRLWATYKDLIVEYQVTPYSLEGMIDSFPLVVNTAPSPRFCLWPDNHKFKSRAVALQDRTMFPNQSDNTIIFNADPSAKWVRSSLIFGNAVSEWPAGYLDPTNLDPPLIIYKPISTDCDCHPTVLRTGRFGAWHNETWVDTAYWDVRTALVTA